MNYVYENALENKFIMGYKVTIRRTLFSVSILVISFLLIYPLDNKEVTSLLTNGGAFKVSYSSVTSPITINNIHSWTLKVNDVNNLPVSHANIQVTGLMPIHNHGLPTLPTVHRTPQPGLYSLEGMKFHMVGEWHITIKITVSDITDKATFRLFL